MHTTGLIRFSSMIVFLFIAQNAQVFGQNYKLVWSDEFDAPTINQFKWVQETGAGGWGNSESQYYTNRTANAYIDSGMLVIKAIKESYSGSAYTSARIKTQGRASWKYGRIEARIKLPYGQGIWPAFWMLGDNISTVSWPKCGEIDIMEMIGGTGARDRTTYGTAHWDNNGHVSSGSNKALSGGRFADEFHVFSITWNAQMIAWYLDDVPYYVVNTTPAALTAFQKNFFIILNLAVGGVWPGYPDASTVFPQMMYVDYVRVYQEEITGISATQDAVVPSTCTLAQNYPNPFNPSTAIHFSIGSEQKVRLAVYDVLGSEVAVLADGTMQAGSHRVEWDARTIPSGVYFYRLRAGSFVETKRLVLQK
jgi:beta-glucanase (GH16 family)